MRRFLATLLFLLVSGNLLGAAPQTNKSPDKFDSIVESLRRELGLNCNVHVKLVEKNRLAMSVEPVDATKQEFVISVDATFVEQLDPDAVRAALAHELGHVWIFTHHPFLQTEALANQVAMKVVERDSLKKLYDKLWAFENTSGKIEDLLGPEPVKGSLQ